MPKQLINLDIDEISCVKDAANQRRWLLIKHAQAASEAIQERQRGMTEKNKQNHRSGRAWGLIQELAHDRVYKWGACEAMPEAVSKVISDHPDLYERYVTERQVDIEKQDQQRVFASRAAWLQIQVKAENLVAKNQGMSRAKAVATVIHAEPALYAIYRDGYDNAC